MPSRPVPSSPEHDSPEHRRPEQVKPEQRGALPRRAVVALVAAVAIIAPTLHAFAAPPPSGGQQPPPSGQQPPPSGSQPPTTTEPPDTSTIPPPSIPAEQVPSGGLPIVPPKVPPGTAPPDPNAAPAPDTGYTKAVGCIRPGPTVPLENRPFAQDALQIDQAHKFATGRGMTVAVIDTGVNATNTYFQGRVIGKGDYVSDKNGLEDCDGHGTIVAGIIGGNTNPNPAAGENGQIGFNGMAPDATIYSIRQTSANYKTSGSDKTDPPQRPAGTIGTLAKAVSYAANLPGVKAINISLTGCQSRYSSTVPSDYHQLHAAVQWAVNTKDVVVVAAAGNLDSQHCPTQNGSGPESVVSVPMPPWFADDVLSVGSINKSGGPSSFSIYGPWVSVAAPGEDIISLSPAGNALVNQRSEGQGKQSEPIVGTSFAAPYVTGLVALVRQRFPKMHAREVMHRIEATAQHPGNASGRDYQVGYGLINPIAALTAAVPGEEGVVPAQSHSSPARIDPPYQRNWTPTVVALGGTGAGIALLLITMITARTIRRNRARRNTPA